jgi:hypothetical protein
MSTRLSIFLAICCSFLLSCVAYSADNELTEQEKKDGFVLLLNGKDLKGWHRNADGYGGWRVEDGAICLSKGGGMLYTDEQFDNYVLKIDFKMSKGCNSGVFLRVGNPRDEVQTGIEVQVQDDHGKKPGLHSCGALYDLVAPSKQTVKPAGEWNTFVVTVDKDRISVEMNGEKVSSINLDQWDKPGMRPDGSKHKFKMALKDFPRKGLIGLQDHGNPICFRNIKLRPLK